MASRPAKGMSLVLAFLVLLSSTIPPALSAAVVPGGQAPPHTAELGANLNNIQSEIDLLKMQVQKLTGQVGAVEAAAAPVIESGHTVAGKIKSFPNRVTAFRQRYGIPLENPTIDQEWNGIQRYLLEKGGMNPQQAKVMAARMAKTTIIEHLKQPFRPTSILMAVGAVAGMNIYRQIRTGEGVDVGKAVSFVKEQSFWGGMVASGVGYALCSYVAASILPPGVGVLAALVPTFAGMTGSLFGWQVGSAQGRSLKEAFKDVSIAELLGQAAGSSLGLILGGQLATVLFSSISLAGPIGAIAGAMILGGLGAKIAGFIRDFVKGDKEGLDKAKHEVNDFLVKSGKVVKQLEKAGILSENPTDDPEAAELHEKYSRLYARFVSAHAENRAVEAMALLKELRETKTAYEERVRQACQK